MTGTDAHLWGTILSDRRAAQTSLICRAFDKPKVQAEYQP